MKNYGLNLEKEKLEESIEDWVFGSTSPECIYSIPMKDRIDYLPKGELQKGLEDFQDCVTRAYLNILESKLTYAYRRGLISLKGRKFLNDNHFINYYNGVPSVELSDRYIAILSGTTREGNSLKAPVEAIRKYGVVPKNLLPANSKATWDDYHDKSKITKELKDLGQEFLTIWPINYEQVYTGDMEELVKKDFMSIALFAWPEIKNGEYPKSSSQFNHAVAGFALPSTFIFDNYPDDAKDGEWIKKLAKDYIFYKYGYRVFFTVENDPDEYRSLLEKLLGLYKTLLALLVGEPVKEEPKPEKPDYITLFAKAVQEFEGWYEGSKSWRNNNPGNIKDVKGNFKVFKTYEEGFNYLKDYITRACTGRHKAYSPTFTIKDFIKVYAPPSENSDASIRNYANHIIKKLGVEETTQLKDLV